MSMIKVKKLIGIFDLSLDMVVCLFFFIYGEMVQLIMKMQGYNIMVVVSYEMN